jgi:hypothetical protein
VLARSHRYDCLVPDDMNRERLAASGAGLASLPGLIEGGRPALQKRIENLLLIGVPTLGSIAAIAHAIRHGGLWSDVIVFAVFYAWCGLGLAGTMATTLRRDPTGMAWPRGRSTSMAGLSTGSNGSAGPAMWSALIRTPSKPTDTGAMTRA